MGSGKKKYSKSSWSSLSKSTWGEQPVKDIPNFNCICVYVCIYLFIYVCHGSWPDERLYRPEIWYTYSHRPYLKTGFLFFFEKIMLGALASKNCRFLGIFRISPRLPYFSFNEMLLILLFMLMVNAANFFSLLIN